MADDSRLDYADPAARPAGPRRPVRSWIILMLVWSLGLIVWTIYLIAIAYLAYKVF